MITGYLEPTDGEIIIDGFNISKRPKKAKAQIGYMPEGVPLYSDLTVKEFVTYMAELKKVDRKVRKEKVEKIIEQTGLKNVENKLTRNLSRGYKQRVSMAGALVGEPKILILDEPTVGLDPKQITEIRELIKELGKTHTVILSSHILSEISEVCEYIFIISRGQLAAEGTEKQLVEQMAGENNLELEIKGDKDKVKEMIESLEDVLEYEFAESEAENIVRLKIKSDRDVDLREKIFYICAENDLPIMEMSFKQKTLEDIFIELTKDYAAPEKKSRFKKKKDKQEEEDNVSDL